MLNQKELIKKVKNYNRFLNPETLSKAKYKIFPEQENPAKFLNK